MEASNIITEGIAARAKVDYAAICLSQLSNL